MLKETQSTIKPKEILKTQHVKTNKFKSKRNKKQKVAKKEILNTDKQATKTNKTAQQ